MTEGRFFKFDKNGPELRLNNFSQDKIELSQISDAELLDRLLVFDTDNSGALERCNTNGDNEINIFFDSLADAASSDSGEKVDEFEKIEIESYLKEQLPAGTKVDKSMLQTFVDFIKGLFGNITLSGEKDKENLGEVNKFSIVRKAIVLDDLGNEDSPLRVIAKTYNLNNLDKFLDGDELQEFWNDLKKCAKDDKFSRDEAKNLLKNLKNKAKKSKSNEILLKELDKISPEQLYSFIKTIAELADKVDSYSQINENGIEVFIINKKGVNGVQVTEKYYSDGRKDVITTDDNEGTTTTYSLNDRSEWVETQKITYSRENGNYIIFDDGNKLRKKEEIYTNDDRTSIIQYSGDIESTRTDLYSKDNVNFKDEYQYKFIDAECVPFLVKRTETDNNTKTITITCYSNDGKSVASVTKVKDGVINIENYASGSSAISSNNSIKKEGDLYKSEINYADGKKEIIYALSINDDGSISPDSIVSKSISDGDTAIDIRIDENGNLTEFKIDRHNGSLLITTFDGDSFADYEKGKLREKSQVYRTNGKEYSVNYQYCDNGKVYTYTHACVDDTKETLSKKFHCPQDEIYGEYDKLFGGGSISVLGKFAANSEEIMNQGIRAEEYGKYQRKIEERKREDREIDAEANSRVVYRDSVENYLVYNPNTRSYDFTSYPRRNARDVVEILYRVENNAIGQSSYLEISQKCFNKRVEQLIALNPDVFYSNGEFKPGKDSSSLMLNLPVSVEYKNYLQKQNNNTATRELNELYAQICFEEIKSNPSLDDFLHNLQLIDSPAKLELLNEKLFGQGIINKSYRVNTDETAIEAYLRFKLYGDDIGRYECLSLLSAQGAFTNKQVVTTVARLLKNEGGQENLKSILDIIHNSTQKRMLDKYIKEHSGDYDGATSLKQYLESQTLNLFGIDLFKWFDEDEVAYMMSPLASNGGYKYSKDFIDKYPEIVRREYAEEDWLISTMFESDDNIITTQLEAVIDVCGEDSRESKLYSELYSTVFISRNKQNNSNMSEIEAQNRSNSYQGFESEAQKIISELEAEFRSANNSFHEGLKYNGWAGETADFVSKLWNTDSPISVASLLIGPILGDVINTRNTKELVSKDLIEFKRFINDLKCADNSPEGCKNGLDFKSIFKRWTNVDYNKDRIEEYFKAKENFIRISQLVIVKKTINKAIDDILEEENKDKALDKMYDFMSSVQDITPDQWRQIKKAIENLGGDFYDYMLKVLKNIKDTTNDNIIQQLGGRDLSIDDLEDLQSQLDTIRDCAFGKNNMINRVEKYNHSQVVGANVVKGIAVALASLTGNGAIVGLTYFTAEYTDAVTNNISNSIDANYDKVFDMYLHALMSGASVSLFNTEAAKDMINNISGWVNKNMNKLGQYVYGSQGRQLLNTRLTETLSNSLMYGSAESLQSLLENWDNLDNSHTLYGIFQAALFAAITAGIMRYRGVNIQANKFYDNIIDFAGNVGECLHGEDRRELSPAELDKIRTSIIEDIPMFKDFINENQENVNDIIKLVDQRIRD